MMKLQEMIDQGYALRGWMLTSIRGERRTVVKLERGKKFYAAHSPAVDTAVSNVEFTEPILLKWGIKK